ncbi:hypothetical protein B0T16DRAFT_97786 [Cercophora newfieldiana]|uniref:Uncharacterized protein n=1 Tax=Cercophora newfieldiana TaxID=92897 RepID=A0AA39YGI7_9PEZI|nr:hypothetical protein B0T16DRAFT_97786 [Cercophora newfieldiana]
MEVSRQPSVVDGAQYLTSKAARLVYLIGLPRRQETVRCTSTHPATCVSRRGAGQRRARRIGRSLANPGASPHPSLPLSCPQLISSTRYPVLNHGGYVSVKARERTGRLAELIDSGKPGVACATPGSQSAAKIVQGGRSYVVEGFSATNTPQWHPRKAFLNAFGAFLDAVKAFDDAREALRERKQAFLHCQMSLGDVTKVAEIPSTAWQLRLVLRAAPLFHFGVVARVVCPWVAPSPDCTSRSCCSRHRHQQLPSPSQSSPIQPSISVLHSL